MASEVDSSPLKRILSGVALAGGLGGYSIIGRNSGGAKAARLAGQTKIINSIKYPGSFPTNFPGGLYGPKLPSLPYGATQGINMSGEIPYGAINSAKFGVQNFNMLGSPTGTVFTGVGRPTLGVTPGMELAAFQNQAANLAGRYPGYYGSSAPIVGGSGLPAGLETGSLVTRYPGSAGASPLGVGDTVSVAGRGGIPAMPAGALEAGTAAEAAGNAGLLARLGYAPAGTTGLSRFIAEGLTPKAALGRLALGATAGQLGASMIVDPLNIGGANSAADRFATGATFGAGLGAAVGNVIPIPGVGAGIGALAGAGIGGLGNVIMGMFDDNSKADQTKGNQKRMSGLNGLMETAGLTDNQRQKYMAQYNTQLEILRGQGKDSASNVAKLLDATEQQISKVAGSNSGKLTSKDMVALQAAIGQYMQPLIQQQQSSGDVAAQLYNQMAGNMSDSAMANLVRGQAAGYKAQADALSAAYMAAAQSQPALYGLQQTAQLANQQKSTQSSDLLATLGLGQ